MFLGQKRWNNALSFLDHKEIIVARLTDPVYKSSLSLIRFESLQWRVSLRTNSLSDFWEGPERLLSKSNDEETVAISIVIYKSMWVTMLVYSFQQYYIAP